MKVLFSFVLGLLLALGIYLNIAWVLVVFYIFLLVFGLLFAILICFGQNIPEPFNFKDITPTVLILTGINQFTYLYVALVTNNETLFLSYLVYMCLTYAALYKMKLVNKKFN